MSSFSKALRYIASYGFFLSAGASAALLTAALYLFLGLGPWEAAGLVPGLVFFVILTISRTAGIYYELKGKSRLLLLSAGTLAVLAGLALNYSFRFEGVAAVGEGQSLTGFERTVKGPFGKPPDVSVSIGNVKGELLVPESETEAALVVNGVETVLAPGGVKRYLSGLGLKLISIEPAPRFSVLNASGVEVQSLFVILRLREAARVGLDYFMTKELPHRFYVGLSGNNEKPLKIRVLRGKLVIFRGEVAIGEKFSMDGYTFSFPEFVGAVVVGVTYYPGNAVVLAGLAIMAAGLIYMVSGRR